MTVSFMRSQPKVAELLEGYKFRKKSACSSDGTISKSRYDTECAVTSKDVYGNKVVQSHVIGQTADQHQVVSLEHMVTIVDAMYDSMCRVAPELTRKHSWFSKELGASVRTRTQPDTGALLGLDLGFKVKVRGSHHKAVGDQAIRCGIRTSWDNMLKFTAYWDLVSLTCLNGMTSTIEQAGLEHRNTKGKVDELMANAGGSFNLGTWYQPAEFESGRYIFNDNDNKAANEVWTRRIGRAISEAQKLDDDFEATLAGHSDFDRAGIYALTGRLLSPSQYFSTRHNVCIKSSGDSSVKQRNAYKKFEAAKNAWVHRASMVSPEGVPASEQGGVTTSLGLRNLLTHHMDYGKSKSFDTTSSFGSKRRDQVFDRLDQIRVVLSQREDTARFPQNKELSKIAEGSDLENHRLLNTLRAALQQSRIEEASLN